jgi:Helix-turn-helix domain of resolvase
MSPPGGNVPYDDEGEGLGASEIAKALKIGRASIYRVLEAG